MLHKPPYFDPGKPMNVLIDWSNANPQANSLLARLPAELRLKIWAAIWKATDPVQHIIDSHDFEEVKPDCDVRFFHAACTTNYDHPDTNREDVEYPGDDEEYLSDDGEAAEALQASFWRHICYHCKVRFDSAFFCEKEFAVKNPAERSAFMGMLLLYKRMHHEIVESMHSSITWCLDINTALSDFSESYLPITHQMRSMIITIDLNSVEARWFDALDAMAAMKRLRYLKLWSDIDRDSWTNNLQLTTIENPCLSKFMEKLVSHLPSDLTLKVTVPKRAWKTYDWTYCHSSFQEWINDSSNEGGPVVEEPEDEAWQRMTPLDLRPGYEAEV